MPDLEKPAVAKDKNFGIDIPVKANGYFLKGASNLDWGMKNRLANIFDSRSGRTVMLASWRRLRHSPGP